MTAGSKFKRPGVLKFFWGKLILRRRDGYWTLVQWPMLWTALSWFQQA